MSGALAAGAITLGAGVAGSYIAAGAAGDAADQQSASARAAIEEQRRQFDALQKLFKPYITAGESAINAQQGLLGLSGSDEQQKAIIALQNSPQFAALTQQGENAILQNGAATGGLRGGNIQSALAQFRPQVLSNLIQQQFGNLGTLSSLGQNSAAQQGNAGQNVANQISAQYGNIGNAQAQASLAQGRADSSIFSGIQNIGGQFTGGAIQNYFKNQGNPQVQGQLAPERLTN